MFLGFFFLCLINSLLISCIITPTFGVKQTHVDQPPCHWADENETTNGQLILCCGPFDIQDQIVTVNTTFRSLHVDDKYTVYSTGLFFGGEYTCTGVVSNKISYYGNGWHDYCAVLSNPMLPTPTRWQATFAIQCWNLNLKPCQFEVSQTQIIAGSECMKK
jgi:hypothetical protein